MKEQEEKSKRDNRILAKETWSTRTARPIIELLTEGTTWIENDHRRFIELSRACGEINVHLCLGSPINYHDILDRASTLRFFQLIDAQKFQFKLAGSIKSWQWMHLLQNGILLLLKSKVLMLSVAPPSEGSEQLSKIAASVPRQQRLSKCDELYSEFYVYSERSKINTLYTIMDLLSSSKTERKTDKALPRNRSASAHPEESIKIVCKTRISGLEEQDLNMLWRMTPASYTLSTTEEQSFLQSDDTIPTAEYQCVDLSLDDVQIGEDSATVTSTSSTSSETTDHESIDKTGNMSSSHDTPTYSSPYSPSTLSTASSLSSKYESRTITGTSFMVLKHLFDPMNHFERSSSAENSAPSILPACLLISNPSPDTLGRFLNASAAVSGSSEMTTSEIGWDIASSPSINGKNNTIFFLSSTCQHVKEILDYMADYSKTSVVGKADFRLKQRRCVSV